CLQGYSATYSF
nr:immunoglobulin light chain junction region [Macaca mulatta]